MTCVDAQRSIQQVEIATNPGRNRFNASRAANLNFSREIPSDADILHYILAAAVLRKELCLALSFEASRLSQIADQIQSSRRKLLRKLDFPDFQVLQTDKHGTVPQIGQTAAGVHGSENRQQGKT